VQHQTSIHERGSQMPHDIEARLERDRADVVRAFSALRDRFSPDSLMKDATSLLTDASGLIGRNAGSYTRALDSAIRANPVALALSAISLAWLILGRRGGDTSADPQSLARTRFEAVTRWENEGGPVAPEPPLAARHDDWTKQADRLRDRAAAMIARINTAARQRGAPVADLARHRTEVMAALTTDVRRVMGRGLEGMTEAARNAALASRERAYELHLHARQKAAEALHERPLTSAAAIAAAGAAVAMVLPRSAFEDRILGQTRDQIVAELERVMRDERQRIASSTQRAAQGLMSELAPLSRRSGEDPAADPSLSVAIPG
jgi:hypothetical protein